MLIWYGNRIQRQIIAEVNERLVASGEIVKETARKSMPLNLVQGIKPTPRSKPGEPPFAQTQKLWKSIEVVKEPVKMRVKVGTKVSYGKDLEFGTANMRWRPWLVPALVRSTPKIKALFAVPLKLGGDAVVDPVQIFGVQIKR